MTYIKLEPPKKPEFDLEVPKKIINKIDYHPSFQGGDCEFSMIDMIKEMKSIGPLENWTVEQNVEYYDGFGGSSRIRLEFFYCESIENKNYEKQIAEYSAKFVEHSIKLEKYNKDLKEYNSKLEKINKIVNG